MKEKIGEVFSVAEDNKPLAGCTLSKEIYGGENYITYFSLAKNTDISAEIYTYHKLIMLATGNLNIYGNNGEVKKLSKGDSILTEVNIPVGMNTETSAIYVEIAIRRTDKMNEAIKAGEVFSLEKLVPYQEGRIVNMDVVHNEKMKFIVMSFDEGTGLSEHAAPGEALVFALDGEAVIGYQGKSHKIKAGETFHFAKGGLHWVKAAGKFKMALLLTLE